jgi:hypothetical protein
MSPDMARSFDFPREFAMSGLILAPACDLIPCSPDQI